MYFLFYGTLYTAISYVDVDKILFLLNSSDRVYNLVLLLADFKSVCQNGFEEGNVNMNLKIPLLISSICFYLSLDINK